MLPQVTGAPRTGTEIFAQIVRVHGESVDYWATYPTPEFFQPPAPGVWSAADQVRHLTKSLRGIAQGLCVPRAVLRVLFGRAARPSRSFGDLRQDYWAVLAAGGKAGRFAPRALEPAERSEGTRAQLMARHADAVGAFGRALARWPEDALDRYVLPHPLLGKLTIREMASFALYHNVHHVHVAERRRSDSSG
jgi:hypothetical protein